MTDNPFSITIPPDPGESRAMAEDLAERARADGDALAAFTVARYHTQTNSDAYRAAADSWFLKAIELGGDDLRWHAVTAWFITYHRTSYSTWLARAISAEFPTPEAPECVGPTYTPNSVGPVAQHPDGPYLLMDTKSEMWGPMARAMLHVVVEELLAAGVSKARIGPAPDLPLPPELR